MLLLGFRALDDHSGVAVVADDGSACLLPRTHAAIDTDGAESSLVQLCRPHEGAIARPADDEDGPGRIELPMVRGHPGHRHVHRDGVVARAPLD